MKKKNKTQKTILIILDGFGLSKEKSGNSIYYARPFFLDSQKLSKIGRNTSIITKKLFAAGRWVGLPDGQPGNSEVGHLHIGAGRIIEQKLAFINQKILDFENFKKNPELVKIINRCQRQKNNLNLIGLFSDGGIHSHLNHLYAILKAITILSPEIQVYLHLILDGRDTKKDAAKEEIKKIQKFLHKPNHQNIKIASIGGRYFAMDRNQNWSRIEKALRAMVGSDKTNNTEKFSSLDDYIQQEYSREHYDEFVTPAWNTELFGKQIIKNEDSVIFFNFRADRARQLGSILSNPKYRKKVSIESTQILEGIKLHLSTFVKYEGEVKEEGVLFPYPIPKHNLASFIAEKEIKQIRIAETEKFAHVTYFINTGNNKLLKGEERIMIPSDKNVSDFRKKPAMKAVEIVHALIKIINDNKESKVIFVNLANCDMVGHSGDFLSTIKTIRIVSELLKIVVEKTQKKDITLVITADHGNSEKMFNEDKSINKSHTGYPVPLI